MNVVIIRTREKFWCYFAGTQVLFLSINFIFFMLQLIFLDFLFTFGSFYWKILQYEVTLALGIFSAHVSFSVSTVDNWHLKTFTLCVSMFFNYLNFLSLSEIPV